MQTSQPMSPLKRFLILGSIALLIILLIMAALGVFGGSNRPVTAVKLRCIATQDVTPFGENILYYDGMTLYCLRANGYERVRALWPPSRPALILPRSSAR